MPWRDAVTTLLAILLAKPRLGLITDMDGTISPIVDEPDQARVTSRSRKLLQALHEQLTLVAVVSGRAAKDVSSRVNLPHLTYLGNHGLERWRDNSVALSPEASHYRPRLETALEILHQRKLPGVLIEDKHATLSIHYRQADNPTAAAAVLRPIVQTVASEQNLKCFEGRMIFELRPPLEINKGTAFRNLIEEYRLEAAIYIGDDTTDVDALQMARQLRESGQCYALGMGVLSSDMPESVGASADILASGISDVEDFLEWLLNARIESSTCL